MEDPVRIRRQMVIMRDHNQRLVLFPDDPLHQFQHIHRRVRIQISSRLVCKNDLWMYHQRPCNADTLLLPAGHLVRHMIADFFQSDHFQIFFRHLPALAARHTAEGQRKRYIFNRIHRTEQVI